MFDVRDEMLCVEGQHSCATSTNFNWIIYKRKCHSFVLCFVIVHTLTARNICAFGDINTNTHTRTLHKWIYPHEISNQPVKTKEKCFFLLLFSFSLEPKSYYYCSLKVLSWLLIIYRVIAQAPAHTFYRHNLYAKYNGNYAVAAHTVYSLSKPNWYYYTVYLWARDWSMTSANRRQLQQQ